jgi:hypothetical protein
MSLNPRKLHGNVKCARSPMHEVREYLRSTFQPRLKKRIRPALNRPKIRGACRMSLRQVPEDDSSSMTDYITVRQH